ncbi:MAG: GNAT family N-acetyltransferase [Gammaproteobacteria bacterium]|nr:GNAT family N-acetyltransferase [Gammaproteobacteria bacterium]
MAGQSVSFRGRDSNRAGTGTIRPALPADCAQLTHMVQTSFAYEGAYRLHATAIRVTEVNLANDIVRVREDARGIVGFYSLICRAGECELDLMYVANEFIRTGIGRALFADLSETARARGYRGMLIVSHPPAAGFYEHMGARRVGTDPPRGTAAWERPRFRFDLERGG